MFSVPMSITNSCVCISTSPNNTYEPPLVVSFLPYSTGGKSGSVTTCKPCRGSGIKVTHRPLGPGMMQQIQSVCTDCGGSGDYIRDKDKCKKCKGKRLVEINHKQEV